MMMERLRAFYLRHYAFILLFLLFVSFRLMAILLFRPGGLITDFSDYDFYYTWGQLTSMGYRVYDNLWTAYPPLFPALMLPIFELSSRIPAWIEPRLFFHSLFGMAMLLFECGNLVLIYRLAGKLARDKDLRARSAGEQVNWSTAQAAATTTATLYALLFVPVYTLIGWFEPMPLFFLLLGLDWLLSTWRGSWIGSAVVVALGFLTKLTPILLLPVAVRWFGARLSWNAMRHEWFDANSPGNLRKPILYVLTFFIVVVGVGYPFVRANPKLIFSSFRVQSIRPPWQSVWALLDGFYGYGLVPLDMRNLSGLNDSLWPSSLPWPWITLGFGLFYLWLYSRAYDWTQKRTPVAFIASSVILLFLYSKGWSPQFLVWILVFIVLLVPTIRGMIIAIALSLINFVEADVFLIMLPDQHWIMTGTVLTRTALLMLLLLEFLGQIWPRAETGKQMQRISAGLAWGVVLAAALATIVAVPQTARAYQDRRLAEHPCREAVAYLREQSAWPTQTIVSQQPEVWRDLYPWLRNDFEIHILDGYSPDHEAEITILEQLETFAPNQEFWWIERTDAPFSGTSPASVRAQFFAEPDVHLLEEQLLGACYLARAVRIARGQSRAIVNVHGGPIQLDHVEMSSPGVDEALRLVLYWQGIAPVEESYTVFVQLFDSDGVMLAQQDNLPVRGLAPTDTWQPGTVVRDSYELAVPPDAASVPLRLQVGMYDGEGRRADWTLPDGTTADHITLAVNAEDD